MYSHYVCGMQSCGLLYVVCSKSIIYEVPFQKAGH